MFSLNQSLIVKIMIGLILILSLYFMFRNIKETNVNKENKKSKNEEQEDEGFEQVNLQ